MKILHNTESLCDICLKRVPAKTFVKEGRVYLEKICPDHGKFSGDHAWDDPEIYKGLVKIKTLDAKSAQVTVAVTYRCNMNCPVCYAKANETSIGDLDITDFDKAMDYSVFFLTGGEPTVRQDLPQILRRLKRRGKKIVMFTNGLKLSNPEYVKKLKRSGLDYPILQFDSVDDAENEYMRGMKLIEIKRQAIENLRRCNMPVYLQSVMLKNKTYEKMGDIFELTKKYPNIKTINLTPLWRLGRYDEKDFVPSSKILAEACRINGLTGRDWLESTNLLCGLDKLVSLVKPRRRIFCKCNLKCLILRHGDKVIPITKIFNTETINRKILKLYRGESRLAFWHFIGYFIIDQVILNFILNGNFRLMVRKMIGNLPYLWRKEYLLFNPLNFLTLAIFPTLRNIDFEFVDECNFNAISSEDFGFEPGCIHRIKALRREDTKL